MVAELKLPPDGPTKLLELDLLSNRSQKISNQLLMVDLPPLWQSWRASKNKLQQSYVSVFRIPEFAQSAQGSNPTITS